MDRQCERTRSVVISRNSQRMRDELAARDLRVDLEKRLSAVTREIDNLTTAIAAGGDFGGAGGGREGAPAAAARTLTRELTAVERAGKQIDWTKVERDLRAKLDDWKGSWRGRCRRLGRS